MSAAHRKARLLLFHTAAIADGVFTAATNLGPLASGSETPAPEGEYDAFMGGEMEAYATLDHLYRVVGAPTLTALQAAKDAVPPTTLYFFIVNPDGTSYTQVTGVVKQCVNKGHTTDPEKASVLIRVRGEGVTAESIYSVYEQAVTLP